MAATWKLNASLLRRHFNEQISSWKVSKMKKVSKWKREIRKLYTSFFVFDFGNFKLVPVDSELNSALASQTYCYKKIGRGTGKSRQSQKNGSKFNKIDLWQLQPQKWKVLEPNLFYWKILRNNVGKIVYFKHDFDVRRFPAKNSQNRGKK